MPTSGSKGTQIFLPLRQAARSSRVVNGGSGSFLRDLLLAVFSQPLQFRPVTMRVVNANRCINQECLQHLGPSQVYLYLCEINKNVPYWLQRTSRFLGYSRALIPHETCFAPLSKKEIKNCSQMHRFGPL